MCAAPHNSNVNTNSEGLILDYTTWSATHFNVPMVTSDFLAALLIALTGVTNTRTHSRTHLVYLTPVRGGHTVALFPTPS